MYIYTKLQFTEDDFATYYRYPKSTFDRLKKLSYGKEIAIEFYYWSIDRWEAVNIVTSLSPREVELSEDTFKKELVIQELQR